MRMTALLLFLITLTHPALAQKQLAKSPRILNARTVIFLNRTGDDSVGSEVLASLKKWGKYQIVTDHTSADLIFLLSADPYHGGNILFADGQTGSVDQNGNVKQDSVPHYSKASPTRYAYLTVIDPKTGDTLWSDKHVWGGLVTGFNSVGARLIHELEKQAKS